MKLSKKLYLSFTALIIISIVIISFISNIMINRKFENYLIQERENKFQKIFDDINENYIDTNLLLDGMELKHYALSEDINITITSLNGEVLYDSNTRPKMGMMRRMHRQGMRRTPAGGNYTEKVYVLSQGNKDIAYLIIGYIDNDHLTQSAMLFKSTLYKSFTISGIITILISLIVSILLSKRLTEPLVKIRDTANEIQLGNLSAYSKVNTDVKEILELSDTINYLGNTLSHQEDIRRRYASDISHELRTPLSTLQSHIEAIIDGVWEPTREHLEILMSEIKRLTSLVDDLRDSFNAEEYNMILNKTRFNISQVVQDTVTSFIPVFNEKNYSLIHSIEENIEVFMDQDKFRQVMTNLLSNSFRYLDDKGKVSVELKRVESNIRIIIEDNGIGIKKENLPFIFNRFYRVDDSRNKDTGGTGLGLPIVKSIVEAHNGNIDIESKYKIGTKVIVYLPLP